MVSKPTGIPQCILVVDDDRLFRWAMVERLHRAGFETREAATFREAEAFSLHPVVDLVILDIRLPDGDGLDLLRRFHGDRPSMPIIMVTASVTPEHRGHAARFGALHFEIKPVDLDRVVALVRAAVSRTPSP